MSQGDSIFVAFPNGTIILVDAATFFEWDRCLRNRISIWVRTSSALSCRSVRFSQPRLRCCLTHGHYGSHAGPVFIFGQSHPPEFWIDPEPQSHAWEDT